MSIRRLRPGTPNQPYYNRDDRTVFNMFFEFFLLTYDELISPSKIPINVLYLKQ